MSQRDQPDEQTTTVERIALRTNDGLALRAERARAATSTSASTSTSNSNTIALVICHPHPLHGGNMFNPVVGGLFDGAQRLGIDVLRFNFRGTNGSEGMYDGGKGERVDALAAVEAMATKIDASPAEGIRQVILAGYSFGADIALQVDHPSIVGWIAVAPPLMLLDSAAASAAGNDDRPTLVVAGTEDQFRTAQAASDILTGWTNTTVEAIEGADHFFAEHLKAVTKTALGFTANVAGH